MNRGVTFGFKDETFWADMFKDHAQFIGAMAATLSNDRLTTMCEVAESECRNWNSHGFDTILQHMLILTESVLAASTNAQDVELLTHMREETMYVSEMHSRGGVSLIYAHEFWKNNFIEHFELLLSAWKDKARSSNNAIDNSIVDRLEYALTLLRRENMRNVYAIDNNTIAFLYSILTDLRHFVVPVDLKLYKMAQHEYKEMKYGLKQLHISA